mmetsp:Transcript_99257/g.285580  ORF Transcript_99257/g.285580 Transcript_99257/m.285580 type:complete len:355 (+) Transcript_99257:118-1182(+)
MAFRHFCHQSCPEEAGYDAEGVPLLMAPCFPPSLRAPPLRSPARTRQRASGRLLTACVGSGLLGAAALGVGALAGVESSASSFTCFAEGLRSSGPLLSPRRGARWLGGPRRGCAAAAGDGEGDPAGEKARGYQFGDLFINKLTGKDNYKFGDISRFFGGKLEEAACAFTGKDKYEFGDLSRTLDEKAKDQVGKFTGKEAYDFGDISKEIARRVNEGEVDPQDLSLLLRVLIVSGIGLLPVAHLLPVQVLLSILNWNLQAEVSQNVSGKVTGAVAAELDRRAKGAVLGTGNEDYVLGDMTRAQMKRALQGITGKEEYEFGDITKAVVAKMQGDGAAASKEDSPRRDPVKFVTPVA